jgi:hypothetical protein
LIFGNHSVNAGDRQSWRPPARLLAVKYYFRGGKFYSLHYPWLGKAYPADEPITEDDCIFNAAAQYFFRHSVDSSQ